MEGCYEWALLVRRVYPGAIGERKFRRAWGRFLITVAHESVGGLFDKTRLRV
jgi:hypothetical protein